MILKSSQLLQVFYTVRTIKKKERKKERIKGQDKEAISIIGFGLLATQLMICNNLLFKRSVAWANKTNFPFIL